MLAIFGSSFRGNVVPPLVLCPGTAQRGSTGNGRSVVQDAPDIGHADVSGVAGICCRDHAQLDPAADGVLTDIVAYTSQVTVDLTDRACLKSVSFHFIFIPPC